MLSRGVLALLLASQLGSCLVYEYEHELWLRVDGSGTVNVTGRPELWTAFKGLGDPGRPEQTATVASARSLFESSGIDVRRVTLTRRGGRPYLFVSADFDHVGRLGGTPAFPDLALALRDDGERLILEGRWQRPETAPEVAVEVAPDELMAVRFHLPSRVYSHRNAADGVERGNILSWRQGLRAALDGEPLDLGAELGRTSILRGTLALFLGAGTAALILVGTLLWLLWRRGRRTLQAESKPQP